MTNRIKQLREAFSLTQEELGKRIGVQKAAVAKYESGTVENLKRSTVEKMAEIFGVSPAFIIGWSDNPKELSKTELKLLSLFDMLNDFGKAEAIKRVSELSFISVYSDNIINNETLMAAHDNNATPDEMQEDILRALRFIRNSKQ